MAVDRAWMAMDRAWMAVDRAWMAMLAVRGLSLAMRELGPTGHSLKLPSPQLAGMKPFQRTDGSMQGGACVMYVPVQMKRIVATTMGSEVRS